MPVFWALALQGQRSTNMLPTGTCGPSANLLLPMEEGGGCGSGTHSGPSELHPSGLATLWYQRLTMNAGEWGEQVEIFFLSLCESTISA